MSSVNVKYYVADITDPSIAPLFDSAFATTQANANRRAALAKKVGATLSFGRGDWLSGFGFLASESIPRSMRKSHSTTHEGVSYTIAVPDKRTSEGKKLALEIDAFNRDIKSFSRLICSGLEIAVMKIGSDPKSPSGMSIYESVCGRYGQRLVFKIPFGGDECDFHADANIPPALKEIKHSEFIAITEEGE